MLEPTSLLESPSHAQCSAMPDPIHSLVLQLLYISYGTQQIPCTQSIHVYAHV